MRRLYVDHAATTPILPEVAEAMRPWLEKEFGNPSSLHEEGRRARQAVDQAREILAARLGCLFGEVLFTGGGSEAANLAIVGSALQALATGNPRRTVLLGRAEHHCVLETASILNLLGFTVKWIEVDCEAKVHPDALKTQLDDTVLLVSVMHANNELGTINDITALAQIAHKKGAFFHTDAVQTFGAMELNAEQLGIDMLSVSAHKIYGPKAVGALYLRGGVKLTPTLPGGGQEREMRAGTENVAGIVGFGEAVRQLTPIKDKAKRAFFENLTGDWVRSVAAETPTLPGHAHIRIPGINAETMLIRLDRMGISASSGAACSSGSLEPSHVLLAAGYSPTEASEGIRVTFGRDQAQNEGLEAAVKIAHSAEEIRKAKRER